MLFRSATVFGFKSSSALAAAYGIAVTGTMIVTTVALYVVMRRAWSWSAWQAVPLCGAFLLLDAIFFLSNLHKFQDGGWLPLAIAAGVFLIMETWRAGRRALVEKAYGGGMSTELFLERADKTPIRVAGTAIFITPQIGRAHV